MAEPLIPTQADRDAAAKLSRTWTWVPVRAAMVEAGHEDDHPFVQAFALHASRARIAALEEVAVVREAAQAVVDCYGVGWACDYRAFTEAVGPHILALRQALSTPQEQAAPAQGEG